MDVITRTIRVILLCSCIVVAWATLDYKTSSALVYGAGTYGTCQFSTCSITLSASSTVSANVTPRASTTTCTIANSNVEVSTGSSTGYTLSLSSSDDTNALIKPGGGAINPLNGTPQSPVALQANTWGYRLDGTYGFGAGPTNEGANIDVPSLAFAGMPPLASPVTIAISTAAAPTPQTTSIKYGVCLDTTTPSGLYSDGITYTAIVN